MKYFSFIKHETKKDISSRGFTLIEMLVAVLIISLVLGVGFNVIGRGMITLFSSRDQITAFYLAQEAVESVKNVRDTNFLGKNDWLEGLDVCFNNDCAVDILDSDGIINTVHNNSYLKKNSSGAYGYADGEDSRFIRSFNLEDLGGQEVRINVVVVYGRGGKSFTTSEHIFNWR